MITENDIKEILKEQLGIGNIIYGKSIFIDNKDLENIAKAILDKIKKEVSKPTKISFNTEIEKDFRKGKNEGRRKRLL